MKLYKWEFRLYKNEGICQVNVKLGTTIKSKDFTKLQDGITELVNKYKIKKDKKDKKDVDR